MFKNEIDAENFFTYLNFKHSNIKFTMEKKNNKFLPFLDVIGKKRLLDFLRNVAILHLLATKSVLKIV